MNIEATNTLTAPSGDDAGDERPKLTRRERIFCDLYLTGLSGAEAVRTMQARSKNKSERPDQVAWRFLQRPAVKAYLAERRRSDDESYGVRKERVIRRLYLAAEGSVKSLYDEKGDLIPIHQLPEDVAAVISGIEVEELFEGRGDAREHTGRVKKVKTIDPNKSAEVLARIMGWNKDKIELDGSNVPPPIIQLVPYDDAPGAETGHPVSAQPASA